MTQRDDPLIHIAIKRGVKIIMKIKHFHSLHRGLYLYDIQDLNQQLYTRRNRKTTRRG